MDAVAVKESYVTGKTSQGVDVRANLVRLTRYLAIIEIYNPTLILRSSEVLTDFKIVMHGQPIYEGRAVIRSILNTGAALVCEAKLDETSFSIASLSPAETNGTISSHYNTFFEQWEKVYKVLPEFKVTMADFQTFLTDLRIWLEQLELELHSSALVNGSQAEVVDSLAAPAIKSIDNFIDRFETLAAKMDPALEPVHHNYLRRQLHPLVLCSPFAHRTFHKPLGYAGDYEVVDMMLRPPYEGGSLFAKILNVWLWGQAPATAHRNRVVYLEQKLIEESLRAKRHGRSVRVFNFACGPAAEIQSFIKNQSLSDDASLFLLDFNEETLTHLQQKLAAIKMQEQRGTKLQFIKKSVHSMLKESGRSTLNPREETYDFVYCAGLFDYLSDNVCKRLMDVMYDMVSPGGLLLATNVTDALNDTRPFRYSMEYILDWHLIYRDGKQLHELTPTKALPENTKVVADDTGVNVFIEVRKPLHG